jgi:tRNA U34 5-methylaminomethyl-2-thiouridine-forming methyltransferase MnmC
MGEAELLHVQGQRLVDRALRAAPGVFNIWDVGLGAAANAIATIEALRACGANAEVHSFENDLGAAEFALRNAEALGYVLPYREALEELLRKGATEIDNVRWHLHLGDFAQLESIPTRAGSPSALLYDPYSPKVNPVLWSLEHFRRLRVRLTASEGCTLSSYSRSSAVRVTLLLAGFHVGIGPASGEKDQTTLAATHPELIEIPLGERWLERVRRSTQGAPLREGVSGGVIGQEDWEALLAHPQFSGKVISASVISNQEKNHAEENAESQVNGAV